MIAAGQPLLLFRLMRHSTAYMVKEGKEGREGRGRQGQGKKGILHPAHFPGSDVFSPEAPLTLISAIS